MIDPLQISKNMIAPPTYITKMSVDSIVYDFPSFSENKKIIIAKERIKQFLSEIVFCEGELKEIFKDAMFSKMSDLDYNNASILMNRYEIMLPKLEEKMNALLDKISISDIEEPQLHKLQLESNLADLQTKESSIAVDKASEKLEKLLKEKEFKLIAKVEHDKAAKNAGLELRPTRLFIFGKPQVGSQLMKLNSTIGLDLPMKILIWEDENGKTQVSYFKGSFLANRHVIENEELTAKIDGVLDMLSNDILK